MQALTQIHQKKNTIDELLERVAKQYLRKVHPLKDCFTKFDERGKKLLYM